MLVDAHARLPLAQVWGSGEVASADGLRFIVPVRSISTGPSPHYFGVSRGVTYFNFTSDQFSGFHAIVIPGTIRDSLYLLAGLLEQQTSLHPTEIMTDSASYKVMWTLSGRNVCSHNLFYVDILQSVYINSDLIFGLFWLLGYQFSPRLADIGETRFWRIDEAADYGALSGIARNRINIDRISRNWDDILRIAGSLKLGTVSAPMLMQALQGGGRPTTVAQAIGGLGRVAKTLYLLAYIDDEAYRRRILIQLNRGETRHTLARHVFHGQRGELRQRYREGQEDQLGALGLVVNMIALWNAIYIQDALDVLRAQGEVVRPEDVERLSPLVDTQK